VAAHSIVSQLTVYYQAEWRQRSGRPGARAGALGRVPRTYIFCERDQALLPAQQQHAIDRCPGIRVLRLDSGHSPFLSQPDRLAELLLSV
jgi:pimeloyl-ACP methyl ester carboxylesterase